MRFEENKCECLYTYAYLRMSSPFAVKSCPQRQIKLLSTVLFTSVGGWFSGTMGDAVGIGQGKAVRDYSEQRFQTEIAGSTC